MRRVEVPGQFISPEVLSATGEDKYHMCAIVICLFVVKCVCFSGKWATKSGFVGVEEVISILKHFS
jgi:hypothetical protein